MYCFFLSTQYYYLIRFLFFSTYEFIEISPVFHLCKFLFKQSMFVKIYQTNQGKKEHAHKSVKKKKTSIHKKTITLRKFFTRTEKNIYIIFLLEFLFRSLSASFNRSQNCLTLVKQRKNIFEKRNKNKKQEKREKV